MNFDEFASFRWLYSGPPFLDKVRKWGTRWPSNKIGLPHSLKGKKIRAQKLEGQLAKARILEQQAIDELKKIKENRDSVVGKLEKQVARTKKIAIEEFKSSDNFQDAVEFTASKYFGESFDFCKRQLSYLHPNLDIFEIKIDAQQLKEEEEEKKEKKEEENKKKGEEKGDTSPFSP